MSTQYPGPGDGLDPQLQAEIDAAIGGTNLEDLVDQDLVEGRSGKRLEREGTVVSIRGNEVFIEFGPKLQGTCPLNHFDETPEPGMRETFTIEREDHDDGMLICSRRGSVQKARWDTIEIGHTIEARCTGTNKGGLEMEVAGHPAFMPAGHVELHHVPNLDIYVGQKLPCEVIELDRQRNRMVLSRRAMLQEQREEARAGLLDTLKVGQVLDAIITRVQPFGAFADIGGLDGLIHVSELSWERVQDPNHLVKVGDAVRVQVLSIDRDTEPPRVGLGMKQLTSDPLQSAMEGFSEGDVVTGTVTKIADFGAFIQLAKGVEGLAHISELSNDHVKRVGGVVKVGETVSVRILNVDPATRRIALSIKQAGTEGSAVDRGEDPAMAKLKARFGNKPLKGGLG